MKIKKYTHKKEKSDLDYSTYRSINIIFDGSGEALNGGESFKEYCGLGKGHGERYSYSSSALPLTGGYCYDENRIL